MNDYERYLKALEIAPRLWEIDSDTKDFIEQIDELKDEMFDLLYEPMEKYKTVSWYDFDHLWESCDGDVPYLIDGESMDLEEVLKKLLNLNALRWKKFTYNIKQ